MIRHCKDNLNQLKTVTENISDEQYTEPLLYLFNSSIGEHIRHALEFYLCLLNGLDKQMVNYDLRKRKKEIESEANIASSIIDNIIDRLGRLNQNQNVEVKANYTTKTHTSVCMHSSLYRELGFCLEHCVHHQALVKTGLKELEALHLVDENFGIAPSTLRRQNKCAQ